MSPVHKALDINAVLSDADFFLQGIDIEDGQLKFIQTSREVLSQASFLDGRTELAVAGPAFSIPLERALQWYKSQPQSSSSDRLIAHTAFCGSTLLARALDQKNRSFVYKEPQALIDMVAIKQSGKTLVGSGGDWPGLVRLCLMQLQKTWSPDEVSIVKPSNWVNILLPDLVRYSEGMSLILLSGSLREFLLAVIRGGRDRFAYVLNFLNQIQLEFPQYCATIANVKGGGSGLLAPLKYCAIAYHMQQQVFDNLQCEMSADESNRPLRMSMQELLTQPEESVCGVARHLGLAPGPELNGDYLRKVFGNHSKDPQQAFGVDQAAGLDREVEAFYSLELTQTIDWYTSSLGDP